MSQASDATDDRVKVPLPFSGLAPPTRPSLPAAEELKLDDVLVTGYGDPHPISRGA